MLIGYARVSTDDQHLDHQRAALRAAGCHRLYEEKISGARRDRPELARLLDHLREGDVVMATERALIAERTHTGRRAAQEKGVRFGRPPVLSAEQVALGQRLLAEGTSVREAARALRCHHATLYRALQTRAPAPEKSGVGSKRLR